MIRFGNATSFHSDLILLKTVYNKRGDLLQAIASKKNFINLIQLPFCYSFCTEFDPCLQISHFSKNRSINYFTIWQSRDQLPIIIPCKFQEHWKQRRLLNRASNITNIPPQILCLQVSILIIHGHCFQVSYACVHLAKR